MRKNTRITVLLALLAAMLLSTALSGCSAINTAKQVANVAKELATRAPDIAKEIGTKAPDVAKEIGTRVPQQLGATPTPAATQLQDTFNNLVKLAPVHLTSAFVSKKGDAVQSSMSYEADVDAAGNQHMKLVSGKDDPVEIYTVGGKMYMGAGEGQFMVFGDVNKDAGFGFLTLYGGAYLLAFNDLQEAKLVGSENVGGFQTKKYEIKMNLGSLGLGGVVAGAQGAQWDYKGFAWVETTKGALVKALVDWSSKDAKTNVTESYHSEFLATKGTVTEIKAPENVLGAGS